jgi:hypothetical protein
MHFVSLVAYLFVAGPGFVLCKEDADAVTIRAANDASLRHHGTIPMPLATWTHNPLTLELFATAPTDESEALSTHKPPAVAALEAAHTAAFQYLHSRLRRSSDNLFDVYARSAVRLNLGQMPSRCVQWNVLQPLLCNSLVADGWLHSLSLSGHVGSDEITRYLTPLLSCLSQPQCTLTGLDLSDIRSPDECMTLLLDALKSNRSLQRLQICDNHLHSSLSLALLQTITAPDATFRLHTLLLWSASTKSTTDDQSLKCFSLLSTYFTRASPPPSLTDLTLRAPHVEDESLPLHATHVKAVCELMSALNSAPNLVTFGIDAIPSSALVTLLQSPYAVSVRLGGIWCHPSHVPDPNLAEALRANTTLTRLHLDELPGAECAPFLAAASAHPTLRHLNLPIRRKQDLTTTVQDSMFAALGSAGCRLKGLALRLNPELCIMLLEALASNRSMTWLCLQLSSVPDSPALGHALIKFMRCNPTLRSLIVTHSGALLPTSELQAALTANRALTEFYWNVGGDGSAGHALHRALLVNRSLTAVSLGSGVQFSDECKQLLHRNQVRSMQFVLFSFRCSRCVLSFIAFVCCVLIALA